MNEDLARKIAHLPTRPGVYQHRDEDGNVLYVGKAKNLRARVNSYFHESQHREGRLRILVSKIRDVDVIVTDTEAEALLLENNLIKDLRPRYNILLRDDKTYPYICIKNEPFPRVFPTRTVRKDGSRYFGPYTDVKNMRLMLDTIRSVFRLRTCALNLAPGPIQAGKYEVCLQYHIKKCNAPCVGLESPQEYDEAIRQVEQLLNGKTKALTSRLTAAMDHAAGHMQFEEAAKLRDQIQALSKYTERQKVMTGDFVDRDLFALAIDEESGIAGAAIVQMREGNVIARQKKFVHQVQGLAPSELLQTVVERYYTETTFFPEEIFFDRELDNPDLVAAFVRDRRGSKVTLHVPQRGDKAGLIRMVARNAELILEEYLLQRQKANEGKIPHTVTALKQDLQLPRLPRRIECFDISHLGGTNVVASCVVFVDGKPRKSEYRTYKVRSVGGGRSDDFQSMREVVGRRYGKIVEENGPWPDLVVIDGGKGQVSSSVEALKSVEAYGRFPIVGIAKRLEEVFFPGDTDARFIPKASASLQLLQRARNEAHRFAVTFQRKQRTLTTLHTELQDIRGIGPKTARTLMKAFGSVKRIRAASEAALVDIVGPHAARLVRAHFSGADPAS